MIGLRVFLIFLLNASVQISLIAAIAATCAFVARRARARVRHAIWALALLLSAILPVLSLSLAPGRSLSAQFGNDSHRWKQMDAFRQKIDSGLWSDDLGGAGSPARPALSGLRLCAAVGAAAYLLFLAYRLGRLFFRWRSTRQMIRAVASHGMPERVMAVVEECRQHLGVRAVSIFSSTNCTVPFTAGVFTPIIVLPVPLVKTASDDELRAALGHELAHIKRYDYLLNIFYELISLPVAFHPSVFWMKRQIERTREAACDELASCCLSSSIGYARALVNLARALPQPPLTAVATSPALGVFDGNNLEERIMQLLDKRARLNARAAAAVFALSVFLLFATCLVGYSFALTPGDSSSQSEGGRVNVSGVWHGTLSEKLPDGRVGHGTVCLRLEQNGDKVTGIGCDTEANANTELKEGTLNGNHLRFLATATGAPKGSILWTIEVNVKGDIMEGKGHAFRSADNHSWDVDIRFERGK
jgi:beta-lactamase regulating signal transducer with metallopeptidase domain